MSGQSPSFRITLALAAVALSASAAQVAPAAPDTLKRYCAGCHNDKVKTGGFTLNTLDINRVDQHSPTGRKSSASFVRDRCRPRGLPRPDENTYKTLLATIEKNLDTAAAAKPNPGRTDTFRRLNRTEYQNAIRDLLAVEVDVSSLLPSDESSHGFDNVTVGDLSPTLLERYLSAAQKISRLAMGSPRRSPGGDTVNLPPDLTQEEHFDELPFGTRGGMASALHLPRRREVRDSAAAGAGSQRACGRSWTSPNEVELMLDGERVQLFTVKPPAARQRSSPRRPAPELPQCP